METRFIVEKETGLVIDIERDTLNALFSEYLIHPDQDKDIMFFCSRDKREVMDFIDEYEIKKFGQMLKNCT